jgi:hypothetical protein
MAAAMRGATSGGSRGGGDARFEEIEGGQFIGGQP